MSNAELWEAIEKWALEHGFRIEPSSTGIRVFDPAKGPRSRNVFFITRYKDNFLGCIDRTAAPELYVNRRNFADVIPPAGATFDVYPSHARPTQEVNAKVVITGLTPNNFEEALSWVCGVLHGYSVT